MSRCFTIAALGQRQAAAFLDGLDADGPVGSRTRQQNSDTGFVAILGERTQEYVDRPALLVGTALVKTNAAVEDRQNMIGRADIDVVGRDFLTVFGVAHGKGRVAAQDIGERAVMAARQMRDEYKGQTGIGRHGAKETFAGFQSACGRANSNYGDRLFRRHLPAPPLSIFPDRKG